MPADTAAKRYSAMNLASPWRGLNVVPNALIPQGERQAAMFLYSGILAAGAATLATITGTATAGITEVEVRAGSKTIVITLTNDTWVASGAAFNAQRQAVINGLDSAQSETHGWNAEVRDAEVVGSVVRTSDTVVTITLSAQAAYDITALETITVTVPSSALTTSLVAVTGAPTFTVSVVAPSSTQTSGGYEERYTRDPYLYDRPPVDRVKRERERLGITTKAAEVIEAVAVRQVADLHLDEHQRNEELERELEVQQIEVESRHLQYLNARREMMIEAEIGRLLRLNLENENAQRMLLLLAAI